MDTKEQLTLKLLDLFPDVEISKTDHVEPLWQFILSTLQERDKELREARQDYLEMRRFLFCYVKQEGEIRLKAKSTLELVENLAIERFDDLRTDEIVLKYSPREENI